MSMTVLPEIDDYWTSKEAYGQDIVKSVFSRKRYTDILRFLHVSNNADPQASSKSPLYQKLHKVQEMIAILNDNFSKAVKPGRNKSLDEGMTRWKGKSSLKQRMIAKPIKTGFKVSYTYFENESCTYIDHIFLEIYALRL